MKNPFEQFEEPQEINKAEVFNALRSYNNPVNIKKTGKEIKEHIENVILPKLLEKKNEIQSQLDAFISAAVVMPTRPCWVKINMSEEEFPYKQYSWEETSWTEKAFGQIFKGFGEIDCCEGESCEEVIPNPYFPQSKEEAESRNKYNRLVEDFRDIIFDIKTANVLLKNLKDGDEYWLNIDQLVSLGFNEE